MSDSATNVTRTRLRNMAQCLFQCLREAHLEKYYEGFTQRGLLNCDSLADLSMQEYSQYGVMEMEDRLRLFKLVQIVKSVQAEGAKCEHENVVLKQHPKVTGLHNGQLAHSNHMHPQKEGTVAQTTFGEVKQLVPTRDCGPGLTAGVNGTKGRPVNCVTKAQATVAVPQPMRVNTMQNQKVVVVNNKKPNVKSRHWIEERRKASPKVVYKPGSDTPIFKCRKTLQFNDSDLDNTDLEDSNSLEPTSQDSGVSTGVESRSSMQQNNMRTLSSSTVPSVSLATVTPSTPSSFLVSSERKSKVVVKDLPIPKTSSSVLPINSDSVGSSSSRASVQIQSAKSPLRNPPIIQVSVESREDHAYFPASPLKLKEPWVEKIYHNAGYNYGIPDPCVSPSTAPSNPPSNGFMDMEHGAFLGGRKIRVCARKRPLTARELKHSEVDVVRVPQSGRVEIHEPKVAVDLSKFVQQHIFSFDETFDETCNNEQLYQTMIQPLVKNIFAGGIGTCFAFGQTGAGKTYTLLGNKTVPGMYKLAGQDIFSITGHNKTPQAPQLWVSYFEIYCGHLFDLLNKRKRLHVRENGRQKVCVAGLMETRIKDISTLVEVIQYGNLARSTGSTGVNLRSSRSHAVLQLEVRHPNNARIGRLTFIDLAGSERASDVTDFDRQTRIEGAEINQSLLALKECIRSLDQAGAHTPYRQSKLTHILRESFIGPAHTVMIAAVSPGRQACENTLNTLRYADRVKELRKPKQSATDSRSAAKPLGSPAKPLGSQAKSLGSLEKPVKTPKRRSAIPPSLFHPSNIQFSSTPKSLGNPGSRQQVEGPSPIATHPSLSQLLQDGSESPIRGHHIHGGLKKAGSSNNSDTSGSESGSTRSHSSRGKIVVTVPVPGAGRLSSDTSLDSNNNSWGSAAVSKPVLQGSGPRGQPKVTSDSDGEGSQASTHSQRSSRADAFQNSPRINNSALTIENLSNQEAQKDLHLLKLRITAKISGGQQNSGSSANERSSSDESTSSVTTSDAKPHAASSLEQLGRSDNDIIREHKEIMSHLDNVLERAKNVMKRSLIQEATAVSQSGGELTHTKSYSQSSGELTHSESGDARRAADSVSPSHVNDSHSHLEGRDINRNHTANHSAQTDHSVTGKSIHSETSRPEISESGSHVSLDNSVRSDPPHGVPDDAVPSPAMHVAAQSTGAVPTTSVTISSNNSTANSSAELKHINYEGRDFVIDLSTKGSHNPAASDNQVRSTQTERPVSETDLRQRALLQPQVLSGRVSDPGIQQRILSDPRQITTPDGRTLTELGLKKHLPSAEEFIRSLTEVKLARRLLSEQLDQEHAQSQAEPPASVPSAEGQSLVNTELHVLHTLPQTHSSSTVIPSHSAVQLSDITSTIHSTSMLPSQTPSHPTQTLSHPTQALSHPTQAPFHPTQAPSHPTQAPSHSTQAPSHPTQAPSHSTQAPSHPTQAPSHPTQAPSHPTQAPSHSTQAPSHPTQAPSHLTQAPSHPTQAPSHPTQAPSHSTQTPSQAPSQPAQALSQAPSHLTQDYSKSVAAQNQSQTTNLSNPVTTPAQNQSRSVQNQHSFATPKAAEARARSQPQPNPQHRPFDALLGSPSNSRVSGVVDGRAALLERKAAEKAALKQGANAMKPASTTTEEPPHRLTLHAGSAFKKVHKPTPPQPVPQSLSDSGPSQRDPANPRGAVTMETLGFSLRASSPSQSVGTDFFPIHPCPITPRSNPEISVPNVITKQVIPHEAGLTSNIFPRKDIAVNLPNKRRHPHVPNVPRSLPPTSEPAEIITGDDEIVVEYADDTVAGGVNDDSLLQVINAPPLRSQDKAIQSVIKKQLLAHADDSFFNIHRNNGHHGDTTYQGACVMDKISPTLHPQAGRPSVTVTQPESWPQVPFSSTRPATQAVNPVSIERVSVPASSPSVPQVHATTQLHPLKTSNSLPSNSTQVAARSAPSSLGVGSPDSTGNGSRSSSTNSAQCRAQSLLVEAHEEHLAEMTALCKQEMKLLVNLQMGNLEFERYLTILDQVLNTKSNHITTLQSHILQVTSQSQPCPDSL